jgi:peptidoglycan/LPS O-acetylase OafA/YrhL
MPQRILSVQLPPDRVFGLDLLRACAILFVVYAHGAYHLATVLPPSLVRLPIMDGVSIFFVLSGFLIGGIILRSFDRAVVNPGDVGRFWIRRWFRTLPNYYLVLSVLTLHLLLSGDANGEGIWKYFLFVQNFADGHPPFFPEAWSLSVEEWFYILLPLGLLALVGAGLSLRSAVLVLICVTAVASPLFRYYRFQELETLNLFVWDSQLRKQVVTRLDSIIYGVLGAYLAHYHAAAWRRYRRVSCAVGLGVLLLHKLILYYGMEELGEHGFYFSVLSFMTIAIGTLLLLPTLSQLQLRRGWICRAVTLISLISYSMYLVHLSLVQRILVPWSMQWLPAMEGGARVLVFYALYWLITIFLSVLIYRFFELPAMNLRERWGRRPG